MRGLVLLGHGASGDATSMAPHVAGLADRGIDARALDLPKGKAERAMPVFREAIGDRRDVVLGGHSFGGRVASLVAADLARAGRPVAGLVLFSYPLHRPGHPEAWEERTAHWPDLGCPVLLLSGESDPFAGIALLRRAVAERLPAAELVTYPRVGHGVGPVLDDAIGRAARFVLGLPGFGGDG